MSSRLAVLLVLISASATVSAAEIDQLYLAPFGNYGQTYSSSQPLQLGTPDYYQLDDGSTWDSGAGSFFSYRPNFRSESIVGSTIRYRLSRPTDRVLWNYDDYDSGNHSSSGVLSLVGDLVVEATVGSKSGVLSGYARVTENDYANYQDNRFNFYAAPVGSVVPVTINYTITGNETFTAGLFGRTFQYQTSGVIDFTNIIPVPLAQGDSGVTYLNKPVALDVLANDLGFDDPATVSILAGPTSGTASVYGSPGNTETLRVTYSPGAGFTGNDSFVYQVTDGVNTASATVTVSILDPTAGPDVALVRKATLASIPVAANDAGFSDPVTISVIGGPTAGTATVVGSPGPQSGVRIAYTPDPDFVGADTIDYEISDGVNTRSATVALTVVNFRANDDFAAVLRNSCCNPLRVLANDIGFANQVTVTITRAPDRGGSVAVRNSPGRKSNVYLEYYPNTSGQPGDYVDTFDYQITDGTYTDTATVAVSVVNFAAVDDAAVTATDTPVVISVEENDIGFDYPRILGVFTNPLHGTAVVSGSAITYSPAPGFLGMDTFEYGIDDGQYIGLARVTVQVIVDVDGDDTDDRVDNCLGVANADQRDTDGDRYGNRCDADLNNSGTVNFADLAQFRTRFGSANADADLDGDGVVNFGDLSILRSLFGKAPGPAALAP